MSVKKLICAALLALVPCVSIAAEKAPKGSNGAMAYHRDSRNFGYAINRPTSREAQIEALKQCGHERCEVVARLRSNCGAIANGPRRFSSATGITRQESEAKALRACGAGCEVIAWACTK